MIVVDARDLICPLPVLRLRKALLPQPAGTILTLIVTDRMASVDVPHFCDQSGHAIVAMRDRPDGALEFTIRRGPDA